MPTSSNGKHPRSRGRTGAAWEKARKRVLRASLICSECNELIDPELRWPDPYSGSVDHSIPVSSVAWDDPSLTDVSTLTSCHLVCNQRKGNRVGPKEKHPVSRDWSL